jgi:signal transduction histidine kinase
MPAKAERRPPGRENERLRARLEELEETLRAIRSGEVDALVVGTAGEDQVFTLKSADQTHRLMVEQMQTGAATLSHDGVVLYSNPFLATLLDLPLEAVLGAPLSGFLDEQGAISLSWLLRAAQRGVSRGEVSFRRGEVSVPTQVSLTLLSLEGVSVYCLIVTDLTERRRREEERAQLEREKVARAAAEEANRLKDEFLATLSHELRSPLNAIVAWSHFLSEPGLDPATASRAVQAIDRNARALSDVIESAADTVRLAAQARDIRLDLPIDPTAGPVLGDAIRLQQVIWNLLSNAIRFAPLGHG